jgi:DNA-binding NarL/FixJ family response regulator
VDTCPAALRVAVVSPREIVACGIVSMLARHGDRIEVVDLGSRSLVADIDVVLVDEAALESADARRADAWAPAAKAVVLLTIEDELRFVDAAVRQGSLAGVVASDVDAADLLRVLETAASGDAPPPWRFRGGRPATG